MAITTLLGSQTVSMDSDTILVWNVRGWNSQACCTVVVYMVMQECISLVCLQELKLSVLDNSLVISICGTGFEYSFLHVVGTRGGIVVAWRTSSWSVSQENMSRHSLSLKLKHRVTKSPWWITIVYGPQGDCNTLCYKNPNQVT
jgi:hypothetical protein